MPEPEIEMTEPEIVEPAPVVKCELCKNIAELREERSRLAREFVDYIARTYPSEIAEDKKCSAALSKAKLKVVALERETTEIREQLKTSSVPLATKELRKKLRSLQGKKSLAETAVSIKQVRHNATRSLKHSIEKKALRRTDIGKQLTEITDRCSVAEHDHPACPGCSMLYGEFHLARPTFTIKSVTHFKGKEFCQYCQGDYERLGKLRFLRRIMDADRYEKSEIAVMESEIAKLKEEPNGLNNGL